MRVAYQCSVRRCRRAFVEQPFQAAGRALKKERFDAVGHESSFITAGDKDRVIW
jgi:hypothetical protein